MYLYWFISSIDIRCFKAIFLIWFLFSLTSLVAQMVKHLSTMWETQVQSLVGKIPWRRKWQSTPVLLPGKPHGQRSLVGYSPRGCKESTEWLDFHFSLFSVIYDLLYSLNGPYHIRPKQIMCINYKIV